MRLKSEYYYMIIESENKDRDLVVRKKNRKYELVPLEQGTRFNDIQDAYEELESIARKDQLPEAYLSVSRFKKLPNGTINEDW